MTGLRPDGGFTAAESIDRYVGSVDDGLFPHEAAAISHFGSPPGRVLDLGCGTGRTTSVLVGDGFDVVGLDVSPGMVDAATDLVPDATYLTASATDVPFADGAFDHVLFSYNGLDYVPTEEGRRRALAEVHRVLADDGRFVFSSHNARYVVGTNRYNPVQYLRVLQFWARNLRHGRASSRYKYDATGEGLTETYFITPEEQHTQLRAAGFDPVETVTRFERDALAVVDPWPYYVAEKR